MHTHTHTYPVVSPAILHHSHTHTHTRARARPGHRVAGPGHHQGSKGPARTIIGPAPPHGRSALVPPARASDVGSAGARGGGHADNARSDVTVYEQQRARDASVADDHHAQRSGVCMLWYNV